MTAMYCWLKVLTVSSMAGLWDVMKVKAMSSLALLLLCRGTLEAWELLFCITEKGSWKVKVTEDSLSKDTDTSAHITRKRSN